MSDIDIRVGSVWVNALGKTLTVDYIGKKQIMYTWTNGKESTTNFRNFRNFYKPFVIELGKRYRTRDGKETEPVTFMNGSLCATIIGYGNLYYNQYGEETTSNPHFPNNNLVEEIKESFTDDKVIPVIKLEVGKRYRTKCGIVSGPVYAANGKLEARMEGIPYVYKETGENGMFSKYDLVEKVPDIEVDSVWVNKARRDNKVTIMFIEDENVVFMDSFENGSNIVFISNHDDMTVTEFLDKYEPFEELPEIEVGSKWTIKNTGNSNYVNVTSVDGTNISFESIHGNHEITVQEFLNDYEPFEEELKEVVYSDNAVYNEDGLVQIGKTYVTSGGDKVGPMIANKLLGFTDLTGHEYWDSDGKYLSYMNKPERNIVAEWVDVEAGTVWINKFGKEAFVKTVNGNSISYTVTINHPLKYEMTIRESLGEFLKDHTPFEEESDEVDPNSSKVKLEVGKSYWTRNAKVSNPVFFMDGQYYAYVDDVTRRYDQNGKSIDSDYDLIEEYTEEVTLPERLKLKVGKYYWTRNGLIAGPVSFNKFEYYANIRGESVKVYRSNGKVWNNNDERFDLVEEITNNNIIADEESIRVVSEFMDRMIEVSKLREKNWKLKERKWTLPDS